MSENDTSNTNTALRYETPDVKSYLPEVKREKVVILANDCYSSNLLCLKRIGRASKCISEESISYTIVAICHIEMHL